MIKHFINKYLKIIGLEINGLDTMHKLRLATNNESIFRTQESLLKSKVSTVFDIGANRGQTVQEYHNIFPDCKIYAFEPFPESFDRLTNATKNIPSVITNKKAIGDKKGIQTFFVNNNIDTNSLLASRQAGLRSDSLVANKTQITVDVDTIDNFCRESNIDYIDILKLDIQGGELAAFHGCAEMLSKKKIGLIYAETYFVEQYLNQPLFHKIVEYLNTKGYQLQDIYDPIYANGCLAWCDAIFLPIER